MTSFDVFRPTSHKPQLPNLPISHKIVILSEAPHRFIACHSLCGAESKDPDGAGLTHAARSFSTTKVRIGRSFPRPRVRTC
jgi:hypothetical protein